MNTMRPNTVRAFSLVEMIAVVSIIALLLALIGIGANVWINSAKVTGTITTMNTLKTAIDAFVDERPIEIRDIDPNVPHPRYTDWFGHLPPCPTTPWKTTPVGNIGPAGEWDSTTGTQFNWLIRRYLQGTPAPALQRRWRIPTGGYVVNTPPSAERDYPSIECLVLFLTQCSPRAKAVIDKMPQDSKENLDSDEAFTMGNQYVPLDEILDAWDRPLRWAVMPHDQDPSKPENKGLPPRWELRSAGKDGLFSAPFTPQGSSDDVVLPGP
ncbi:MAG: type II secretion system protein [Phycisphaerae bacterium]|nr:type II secretion system protein [Phycisphaerae bacterium]